MRSGPSFPELAARALRNLALQVLADPSQPAWLRQEAREHLLTMRPASERPNLGGIDPAKLIAIARILGVSPEPPTIDED